MGAVKLPMPSRRHKNDNHFCVQIVQGLALSARLTRFLSFRHCNRCLSNVKLALRACRSYTVICSAAVAGLPCRSYEIKCKNAGENSKNTGYEALHPKPATLLRMVKHSQILVSLTLSQLDILTSLQLLHVVCPSILTWH